MDGAQRRRKGEPGMDGARRTARRTPGHGRRSRTRKVSPARTALKDRKVSPAMDGAQGPQGEPGMDGAQGPQGEPGQGRRSRTANGQDGLDGQDGAQGPQGEPGMDGLDGQDGASAYEIWLSLGNTGSEQDFIDYLSGNAAFAHLPHMEYLTQNRMDQSLLSSMQHLHCALNCGDPPEVMVAIFVAPCRVRQIARFAMRRAARVARH